MSWRKSPSMWGIPLMREETLELFWSRHSPASSSPASHRLCWSPRRRGDVECGHELTTVRNGPRRRPHHRLNCQRNPTWRMVGFFFHRIRHNSFSILMRKCHSHFMVWFFLAKWHNGTCKTGQNCPILFLDTREGESTWKTCHCFDTLEGEHFMRGK